MLTKSMYAIGVFFIIFAFPLVPFFSSAKIITLFVVFISLLLGCTQHNLGRFQNTFGNFSAIYFLLFFYTLAITTVTCVFDWSLVFKSISSYFFYIVSFSFFYMASRFIEIKKVVVYSFLVQSLIIIISIFSESFFNLTDPFRPELTENHVEAYSRLRGTAVCGYQYFAIASMYSFIMAYLLLHYKEFKYSLFLIVILSVASICSGRFSVVGIFIGIGFMLLRDIRNGKSGRVMLICISALIVASVLTTALYFYAEDIEDPVMKKVMEHYLIQPIDSLLFGDQFQTSSTDVLLEMYEKDDIKKYFWLGAGRYNNPEGGYFGGVDIGYYRMLGYYGIPGFLILLYIFYYLIYRTQSNLDLYTKHAFFLNFLVLNLKGDVQVFNNNIVPILVAFLFFASKNPSSVIIRGQYQPKAAE